MPQNSTYHLTLANVCADAYESADEYEQFKAEHCHVCAEVL